MASRLADLVGLWADRVGVDPGLLPSAAELDGRFGGSDPTRPPADPERVAAWERRHGFALPEGLRAWLRLSDGFYHGGPVVHPLSAIGPMIPFARVPDLIVQPESWFELGNPGDETLCIDLGYRWPGGDAPLFTSGADDRRSRPRIIAAGFDAWFLRLLREGGRPFWFDSDFPPLGDPWTEHRRRVPTPPLPARLRPLASRVRPLMRPGADERTIAGLLGITRGDVEALFRHLQHAAPGLAEP